MAERKFGITYKMSTKFEDYSYIINGVGGIGKTTMIYQIGKYVTGSNEGTFIITCGGENKPKHIPDAFGDVAPNMSVFISIVDELCDNKEAYPNTKFVGIDSLDEFARITEAYVVKEWNKKCDISERAKSIAQAYKGYRKGENRATDIMINQLVKLQNAGYSVLLIGHTKTKAKSDVITQIQFEQLTCNLDNQYYNALKDKVNLVAMCYFEHIVDNVEEKKNAFTKKMEKVGELVDRKRVMVFADDDNAVDCKSHFEYIAHKIDFDAIGFVNAVEEAIQMKLNVDNGTITTTDAINSVKTNTKKTTEENTFVATSESDTDIDDDNDIDDIDDEDNLFEDEEEIDTDVDDNVSIEDLLKEIRTTVRGHKDLAAIVKTATKDNGFKKLDEINDVKILKNILKSITE